MASGSVQPHTCAKQSSIEKKRRPNNASIKGTKDLIGNTSFYYFGKDTFFPIVFSYYL